MHLQLARYSGEEHQELVAKGTIKNSPLFLNVVLNGRYPIAKDLRKPRRGERKVAPCRRILASLAGLARLLLAVPSDQSLGYYRASLWD